MILTDTETSSRLLLYLERRLKVSMTTYWQKCYYKCMHGKLRRWQLNAKTSPWNIWKSLLLAKAVFNTSSDRYAEAYYHEGTKRFFYSRGQPVEAVKWRAAHTSKGFYLACRWQCREWRRNHFNNSHTNSRQSSSKSRGSMLKKEMYLSLTLVYIYTDLSLRAVPSSITEAAFLLSHKNKHESMRAQYRTN